MHFLPPTTLQTAERAEEAFRRINEVPPKVALTIAEDPEVPGAFKVWENDYSAVPDVWWYGIDAQVHKLPADAGELQPRQLIIDGLNSIERTIGTIQLPVAIQPDPRVKGAVYVSVQDEDTVDHWISPNGDVVVRGRTNAVASEALIEAQSVALSTVPQRSEVNNDISGITLP